jgi:hypothetical protein
MTSVIGYILNRGTSCAVEPFSLRGFRAPSPMIMKGNRSRRYVVDLSSARASTEAAVPCLALIESGMNTIKRDCAVKTWSFS